MMVQITTIKTDNDDLIGLGVEILMMRLPVEFLFRQLVEVHCSAMEGVSESIEIEITPFDINSFLPGLNIVFPGLNEQLSMSGSHYLATWLTEQSSPENNYSPNHFRVSLTIPSDPDLAIVKKMLLSYIEQIKDIRWKKREVQNAK